MEIVEKLTEIDKTMIFLLYGTIETLGKMIWKGNQHHKPSFALFPNIFIEAVGQ